MNIGISKYGSLLNERTRVADSVGKYLYVLFLIWPFLSLIAAIANYRLKESRIVVYMFLVYYGLTFVIGNLNMDSAAYVTQLERASESTLRVFLYQLRGLYAENVVDIYSSFMVFLVSRFTSDYRILFAIFASVFGYFHLKSINLLHGFHRENPNWNTLIFLVFFIIILPITAVNGVRMWTAAWIFFYAAIHVVLYRDKRYLLLALLSILIHWSFLTANVVLLIYFFLGNRDLIYGPLAIVSYLLQDLLMPVFSRFSMYFGGAIENRYSGYTSEGYISGVALNQEQTAWFVFLSYDLAFYFLFATLFVIFWIRKKVQTDEKERNLFSFILLFLSFVNFGRPIPSFGFRFQIIFFLFTTFYLVMLFAKEGEKRLRLLSLLGLAPLLLYAAVNFRVGSETINALLFSPGLGLPLLVQGIPLAEWLF
ncbi:MAG: EpsG family protein [Bacteroidales bacterium]|nr:EpsG family protein [Bacteroidales bacterium]